MNANLNLEQFLNVLGISSINEMKKEDVVEFASMIDELDPDVVKAVLEQYPTFASTSLEIFKELKEVLGRIIEFNNDSINRYYDLCETIIGILEDELKNGELCFEEKKYVIEVMKEILDMMSKKDTEDKQFHGKMAMLIGSLFTAALTTLGVLFIRRHDY